MSSFNEFSECPGEIYDDLFYLSEDEMAQIDDVLKKATETCCLVTYFVDIDLVKQYKEFNTMKEALEFSLKLISEGCVVDSVITDFRFKTEPI